MEFKKTDTAELQKTMAIVVCAIMVLIPIVTFMQKFTDLFSGISGFVNLAEVIVCGGAILLLVLSIMYLKLKENRYLCILDIVLILFFISLVLSTVFSTNVAKSLSGNTLGAEGLMALTSYIVIMFSVSLIHNKKYRNYIWISLIIVGLFEASLAVFQSVLKLEVFWDISEEDLQTMSYRAYGTLINPNPYGALMGMIAGVELGRFFTSDKNSSRLVHGLLIIIFVWSLFISGTRAGILGLVFSAFTMSIYLIVVNRKDKTLLKKTFKTLGICIGVCLISVVLVYISSKNSVVEDIIQRFKNDTANASSEEGIEYLGSSRVGIWLGAINKYFPKYPLFGAGMGNFFLYRYILSDEGIQISYGFMAHNEYIDVLCTRGLVGLIMYLLLLGYVLVSGFTHLKKYGVFVSRDVLGAIIAIIAFMITDIFGWHIIFLTPYFYVLMGLCVNRDESKRLLGTKAKKVSVSEETSTEDGTVTE